MKILKEIKWNTIVTSVVYIALGIVLLFMPTTSLYIILNIIGIGTAVAGLLSLIRYFTFDANESFYRNDFLLGLIGVAIGLLIFLRKDIFASLIPFLLGIAIMFSGFVKLQDSIDAKRMGYQNSVVYIVLSLINIVVGIVVILNPFKTSELLFMIIGAGLMYSGISDLVSTVYLSRRLNKLHKELKKNIVDVEAKTKDE